MRILRAAGCHILRKTAAQVELKPVLCGFCPEFFLGRGGYICSTSYHHVVNEVNELKSQTWSLAL